MVLTYINGVRTMWINIKKSVAAVLLLTFILSFCACGSGEIISLDDIPEYSGEVYVEINGGVPFFTEDEITDDAYERYSPLDALGRCGVAMACLGVELMPDEEREDIGSVTPSGWEYNGDSNNRQYSFGYLYNRCHLIGFQLAGENDNEENLITGTAYLNVDGMLPFENDVDDYIEKTGNHVMYRVTPIYDGYDLVARGVLMEAYSVEDDGRGLEFCIYVYNVQPGVEIDYFTGRNRAVGDTQTNIGETPTEPAPPPGSVTYVLNKKSKKFHYPEKSCAESISEANREDFYGTREELISEGYSACGKCKP